MKSEEKKRALMLRAQGHSMKEISKQLGVAKSSVSLWVRHVELTESQKDYLRKKGFLNEAIENRRKSRLAGEKLKRDVVINAAQKMVPKLSKKQLWLIGIALYWGEGGKTRRAVSFSNSDPRIIRIIMMFFREVCDVPEDKFRGHIHIHPHLDHTKAEVYWSSVSGIPHDKLYKTYRIPSKASQGKKDTLPYGTLGIYVLDTQLFYKIIGWVRGISSQLSVDSLDGFGADERT